MQTKVSGTPYQRDVLKELKPRGFVPQGYDKNGRLWLVHDETGYRISVASKAGEQHSHRNLIKMINRDLKKASDIPARFERHIWEKYDIPPGMEKSCALSLASELRDWAKKEDVHNFSRTGALNRIRKSPNFQNMTGRANGNGSGDEDGPARRIWLISRPEEPEIERPWVLQPEEESPSEAASQAPPDAREAMALGVQEKIEEHQENTPSALGLFDPELIDRLKHAFAGPVMLELQREKELNQLLTEELTKHISQVTDMIEGMTNLRESMLNLLEVAAG